MSVIIKDLEMPKEPGVYCLDLYVDEICQVQNLEGATFEAIEIPPHGRLIDADALIIGKSQEFIHKSMVFGGQYVFSESAILNAPTVIEADYPPSTPLEQVWTELFGEGESDVRRTD